MHPAVGNRLVPIMVLTASDPDGDDITAWEWEPVSPGAPPLTGADTATPTVDDAVFIRVNRVGYLPEDPKIAILSSSAPVVGTFRVGDYSNDFYEHFLDYFRQIVNVEVWGDVALHPDFEQNGLLYLSYVEAGEGRTRGAAVSMV